MALLLRGHFMVQTIGGLSAMMLGGLALISATSPNQPLQLFGAVPIKGKHLLIGTIVFIALFSVLQGDWPGLVGTLAAIGLGWFWQSAGSPSAWLARYRKQRLRRRFQVVPRDDSKNQQNKQWLN
jgi:hypothetical protein